MLIDFLKEIDEAVQSINSPDFEIEVTKTKYVPSFDDGNITYGSSKTGVKKCKSLESCVLYVDIRNSAQISSEKEPEILAKMYASFVSEMIACAEYFNGYVRNIIGDRVMVVFDQDNCFVNAVNAAVLMNTVCQYIINKRTDNFEFRAGIGIDYGPMLITKAGVVKKGAENEFYKSLVWLGKPANTASRLTDIANKTESSEICLVNEGYYSIFSQNYEWCERTPEQFISNLIATHSDVLKHKNAGFGTFFKFEREVVNTYSPILMTKAVFDGFCRDAPNDNSVTGKFWSRIQNISVRNYDGDVYGGDVTFLAAGDL